MSGYYAQQNPPYPTQDPVFVPPQSYPPAYAQQQSYPQAYPQQQNNPPQYQSPPPQYQNYYPPMAQQQQREQQNQWNPQQIYAEANGLQQPSSRGGQDFNASENGEGERGIGATLLGGGAGAFLGHEMGHGKMATLGGLAVGAIAANVLEHHHEKKKRERHLENAYDDGYVHGESRGIDEGDHYSDRSSFEEEREGNYEYEPRHHHHHHHDRDYDDRETVYQDEGYYRSDRY